MKVGNNVVSATAMDENQDSSEIGNDLISSKNADEGQINDNGGNKENISPNDRNTQPEKSESIMHRVSYVPCNNVRQVSYAPAAEVLIPEKPRPSVNVHIIMETNLRDEADDLGIYDDPGDIGDDLSDTEVEPPRIPKNYESVKDGVNDLAKDSESKTVPQSILRNATTRDTVPCPEDQGSHVTWSAQKSARRTVSDYRYLSGIRGMANTPASHMTDVSSESRNTSRVPSESREAMFARAMKLLTARCTSVQPGVDTPFGMSRQQLPFGVQIPQYFYIRQEKPTPMPPLKAWQGYNGNVYFEPIQISSVRDIPPKETSTFDRTNELHRMLMQQKTNRPDSEATRSISRNTGKTATSTKSGNRPLTRQMVLLDKRVVLDRYNDDVQTDLQWIEGSENTGSLAVRPKSDITSDRPNPQHQQQQPKPEQGKKSAYNRERICKGSVVHKLHMASKANQPVFKVNGGKYTPANNNSPHLLRTQTQYSLSNQRLTTNSPDISNPLLPPLEQLRTQVRRMDHGSERVGARARPVTYTEDMKPFIKYSHEIKAKGQTTFV